MKANKVSTPTHERCVTSYAARTQYKPGEIHPPHIKVKDAIDIHCHAHEGQQNPFDLAKRASLAEMKGLLFKSIPGDDPAKAVREVQEETNRWADREGVEPIHVCDDGPVLSTSMTSDPAPRRSRPAPAHATSAALAIGALGIVFGDLGTSPLYTMQECFTGPHGFAADRENVLGVVSLIVWSINLVVTVKYLAFLMRADNRGEGGILALLALLLVTQWTG